MWDSHSSTVVPVGTFWAIQRPWAVCFISRNYDLYMQLVYGVFGLCRPVDGGGASFS